MHKALDLVLQVCEPTRRKPTASIHNHCTIRLHQARATAECCLNSCLLRICEYTCALEYIGYNRIVFPTGISICFIYHVLRVVRVEENINYAIIQRMLLGSEAHEEDIHNAPEDIRN